MILNSFNSEGNSEAASEQNFLSHLDEQAEVRGTPSQIRHINTVTAKLDQLRHSYDKDETDISATLDKLVETLKKQQVYKTYIMILFEGSSATALHKNAVNCQKKIEKITNKIE